jgi:hypothetical protein
MKLPATTLPASTTKKINPVHAAIIPAELSAPISV